MRHKCLNHRSLSGLHGFIALSDEMVFGPFSEETDVRRCPDSGRLPVSRVSATHPNPAGHLNSGACGPLLLQPCTRLSREPHRSLAVVPLIGDKRYYGEGMGIVTGAPWHTQDAVAERTEAVSP
jgi:hypothetical protein